MATQARIDDIEEEMARTQKNKATAKHLGLLKAKLAKLKAQALEEKMGTAGGGPAEGFDVTKSGDTRIGMIGFPSVGKSTLLTKLTGTESEAAAYEFTTLTCIPGTIKYRGARVQLLDLPGIIEGASDGKGRGRQVIGTARTCNCLIIVLDSSKPITHKRVIEKELEGFGIRLNKTPPRVTFKRKKMGGVNLILHDRSCTLDKETVTAVLREYKVVNADIHIRCNATIDDIIDVVMENVVYIPAIYAMNKIDAISLEELELLEKFEHYVPISAKDEWNFDELLAKVWDYCKMLRVYTKPRGQIPDLEEPVILHDRSPSIEDFCNRIHRNLMPSFKFAWVWGRSVKHQPQRVGKDHILMDEDVVQIVKKV